MLSFARFHCLQGSTVAPLYNYLLQQAANGGQFGADVDVLADPLDGLANLSQVKFILYISRCEVKLISAFLVTATICQ